MFNDIGVEELFVLLYFMFWYVIRDSILSEINLRQNIFFSLRFIFHFIFFMPVCLLYLCLAKIYSMQSVDSH